MPPHAADPIEIRTVLPEDEEQLAVILRQAMADGELPGWSPADIRRWIEGFHVEPENTYVAVVDDRVAGLLSTPWEEVTVAPWARRRGVGRALVARALATKPDLRLAPPRGSAGAEAFCRALGFVFDRNLWQLALPPETPARPLDLPPGFLLRAYRVEDLEAYARLLNEAFADHPTAVEVPRETIERVHARPAFDPSHIALVVPADDSAALAAFCRVIPADEADAPAGAGRSGEIGMLAVAPAWRRRGLARALLRWGIQRLRDEGCADITLAVEDANDRALDLYRSEGFIIRQTWPRWRAAPSSE